MWWDPRDPYIIISVVQYLGGIRSSELETFLIQRNSAFLLWLKTEQICSPANLGSYPIFSTLCYLCNFVTIIYKAKNKTLSFLRMTKCVNNLELLLGTWRVKKFTCTFHIISLPHFSFTFTASGFPQAPFWVLPSPFPYSCPDSSLEVLSEGGTKLLHTFLAFHYLISLQHWCPWPFPRKFSLSFHHTIISPVSSNSFGFSRALSAHQVSRVFSNTNNQFSSSLDTDWASSDQFSSDTNYLELASDSPSLRAQSSKTAPLQAPIVSPWSPILPTFFPLGKRGKQKLSR